MKREILFVFILFILNLSVSAQKSIDDVLKDIEKNNTSLKALKTKLEANTYKANTGKFLSNPTVSVGYNWGDKEISEKKTSYGVSQAIDFPTSYMYRSRKSKLRVENAKQEYEISRLNVLLASKQVCINLIYYNLLDKAYETRLKNANSIVDIYKKKFNVGEINKIEYNKVQLNLSRVESKVSKIKSEKEALLNLLKKMNGGISISFDIDRYKLVKFIDDFKKWYSEIKNLSPELKYLERNIELSKQDVKLKLALSLPKFSIGYTEEHLSKETMRGVSFGVSIPLWENKNTVKAAKAEVKYADSYLKDAEMNHYTKFYNLYEKANKLRETLKGYRKAIKNYNSLELLEKSLFAKEISLLEYIVEVDYYYDSLSQLYEVEKDLYIIESDLFMYNL